MSKIITLEQLQDVNPGIADGLGALVVAGVNDWIENATSRCWGESKTVTELYDASGVIWLNHMDVTAVSAVKYGYPGNERTTIASPYRFTKQGRLLLHYGREFALPPSTLDYIEVTYTYGVPEVDVPDSLKLAAIGIALGYSDYIANSGREATEAQVGSYRLKFSANPDGTKTKARDWEVVNSYAMRRV